jgi:hypothetical protein
MTRRALVNRNAPEMEFIRPSYGAKMQILAPASELSSVS